MHFGLTHWFFVFDIFNYTLRVNMHLIVLGLKRRLLKLRLVLWLFLLDLNVIRLSISALLDRCKPLHDTRLLNLFIVAIQIQIAVTVWPILKCRDCLLIFSFFEVTPVHLVFLLRLVIREVVQVGCWLLNWVIK